MNRSRIATFLALLFVLTLGGCGTGHEQSTPAACLDGQGAYTRALATAPAAVTLGDGTRISDCLVENQSAGELSQVGLAMITAATKLNGAADGDPGGEAAVRLGYLVGAASRGAEDTNGIHAELIRRLGAAASYSPENRPLPPDFKRAYESGYDAGHSSG